MAISVATKYQTLLNEGEWAKAWAMLSPESRQPYDDFSSNWAAVRESWHSLDFTLGTPTHDWQTWDVGQPIAGNYGRAYIIEVTYPFTSQTNYWDVLLIMPTRDATTWTVSEER